MSRRELLTKHLWQPSKKYEDIENVYIFWKKPGPRWRQYFRSAIVLKNVTVTPSEKTADGKFIDHTEQARVLCTRNRRVVDLDYVMLHPCDEN